MQDRLGYIKRIAEQTGIDEDKLELLQEDDINRLMLSIYESASEKTIKEHAEAMILSQGITDCEHAILGFYKRSYEDKSYDEEYLFDDYSRVVLAEDKCTVYVDLLRYKMYKELYGNGENIGDIVYEKSYNDLQEMYEDINHLNYNDLVQLNDNQLNGGMVIVDKKGEQSEIKADMTISKDCRIFVDMDGTLARFHDEVKYLERMWEEGFFKQLKPFEEICSAIKLLKLKNPDAEIYILSAAIEGEPPYCQQQKHEWLDKYLPEIDREHRIFTTIGKPKADFIKGGIRMTDILIDDYNKGLEEWEKYGGTAVKCVNNINHKGLVGPLWEGKLIHNDKLPPVIASDIVEIVDKTLTERNLDYKLDNNYESFTADYESSDFQSEIVGDGYPIQICVNTELHYAYLKPFECNDEYFRENYNNAYKECVEYGKAPCYKYDDYNKIASSLADCDDYYVILKQDEGDELDAYFSYSDSGDDEPTVKR